MEEKKQILGIDLGTTYSCVAILDEYGRPQVLANRDEKMTTPSIVSFEDDESALAGEAAKNRWRYAPEQTVAFIKRHMTRDESFSDEGKKKFPFSWDPSLLSATILKKVVSDANERLERQDNPIKDVVITCPAYFDHVARERTRQAGEQAGLNVLDIIEEPTAAAIAYGIKQDQDQTVLVYDLGGGTFDVTILKITGNSFKVIATGGDPNCGGYDWDKELAASILDIYNKAYSTDFVFPSTEESALAAEPKVQRMRASLLLEAERIKIALTASKKGAVETAWQFEEDGHSCPRTIITREKFDELTAHRLDYTIDKVNEVIAEAKKKGVSHIDTWILVGGSSYMPQVKERLNQEFNCDAKISDPNQCVAKGAAIYAATLVSGTILPNGKSPRIETVCTKTYGTDCSDNGVKKVKNLIFSNDPLPADATDSFSTLVDDQSEVSMEIYESEVTDKENDYVIDASRATLINKDNSLKIKSKLKAGSKITVKFHIDKSGGLHVTATAADGSACEFDLQVAGVKSAEELAIGKKLVQRATEKNL